MVKSVAEFTIREARITDAPGLAALLRELGWFAHIDAEPPAATELRVRSHLSWALTDGSHSILVGENAKGEILGYAAVHWVPSFFLPGPEGYVSDIFVRDEGRGRGLGTALLERLRAEAKGRGCVRLTLINLRGRESYRRGFYTKRGWEERSDAANFLLQL
ncbi:MAG: GNAT family N-acetyltransferase [Acidobacteria bacterium]|nr:GNAT family N-acetyltransferase [Acidobacteriota bacterium]